MKEKIYVGKTKAEFIEWLNNRYPYTPIPSPEPVPTAPNGMVLYRTTVDGEWLEDNADISNGTFNGFANKESAVEVIIPSKDTSENSVTSIGSSAFRNCSGLTSVMIPDSMTSIGLWAFEGCSGLTNVTIPDSVTSIGGYAFRGCSEFLFDTTTIPGVKLVDGWVVDYTNALSDHLNLTGSRGIGDQAFFECSSLTSVTIPDSVTSIGASTFNTCANLMSVTIPDSVTSIGFRAFFRCQSLTSITIPSSVTNIGEEAFCWCMLTRVEFEGNAPTVGSDAFAFHVFGCKVAISSTATGFPAVGETWNGMIVEVKQ